MVFSSKDAGYRRCTVTVMDNIADPDIHFDREGICNYYYEYKEAEKNEVFAGIEGRQKLSRLADEIRAAGKSKPYDCLIGLSGGIDSSYTALLVKKMGLRPLAVHLDNGWNTALAVKNIENITGKLGIDLFTLVVNWEEFKDIQLSFLRASVVDIEMVSDHAILATMYKLAKEKKIKYIISGTNVVTEYIMPPQWLYRKMDAANLLDIHRRYGRVSIKTYPVIDFKRYVYYSAVLGLKQVSILNYIDYNKKEAGAQMKTALDWADPGGKHFESVFTKFYQAFILPEKFHIDKRKPHLSNLICAGQLSREQALGILEEPALPATELETCKPYVLKKLGLTEGEFESIMQLPAQAHHAFKSETRVHQRYMRVLQQTEWIRYAFRNKDSKAGKQQ